MKDLKSSWIPSASLCGKDVVCDQPICVTSPLFTPRNQGSLEYVMYSRTGLTAFPSLIHLSGDVELNPGPGSRELEELKSAIIRQIKESEERLSKDIHSMKKDIESLKSELSSLRKEVRTNAAEQDILRQDIDALIERTSGLEDVGNLADRLEDQERRGRRNNMVMYGIPEAFL